LLIPPGYWNSEADLQSNAHAKARAADPIPSMAVSFALLGAKVQDCGATQPGNSFTLGVFFPARMNF